jgi:manganese/zinc/iron transport system substrate-binding protein
MIAEMVREVGGDRVVVSGLMGPGVDPHLYKASEGDVTLMSSADVIFYNGLHLEGKMGEIFEQMSSLRIPAFAVADAIPESSLLESAYFTGNYDPHIWFDASLWRLAALNTAENLASIDSTSADVYRTNAEAFAEVIAEADRYVRLRLAQLPPESRILVTSHDAFGYFGRAYGFEVNGLQGLSTAAEAGTADVAGLADFVASRRVPALFLESSVSPRGIEAVRAAVRARGFDVLIGGTLFGDALGAPGTAAGTYAGMVRSNIDTIVAGLSKPADS